jgi:hypothetical protein
MATTLFDFAAQKLEQHTGFSQLEARGTLRIAVKAAGLDAAGLKLDELRVVLEKLMPGELEQRGVSDSAAICAVMAGDRADAPATNAGEGSSSAEDVFRRLAKG